ncbi:MAG: NAD+ synthase [Proteobacteria bacterium]|nr:NAD+ synthase [Pseudomonadota bacterium]
MKIALVQINPVIGDFNQNCEKIERWAKKAGERGCNLAIFPELVVSGYPPQDLLERQSFLAAHDQAVSALLSRLPAELDVMFGCLERRMGKRGKGLYNSAVVVRQGKIVYRARKQLLPSYDVFDETRYFERGESSALYQVNGMFFGVTVCEDVWSDKVSEYQAQPVPTIMTGAVAKGQAVDAIINISASPFQRDKEKIRKGVFKKICREYRVPFLYCNQIGGQDSLLFDGRSLVMDSSGTIVAQAHGFREDMIIVDSTSWQGEIHGAPQISEQEAVYQGLVMGVGDYVRKCGFSSALLGLSGGIDSALTAAIAVDALGAGNVLGVALPSPYSSPDSLEDAQQLADNLGCRFTVLPIGELFDTFRRNLAGLFAGLGEDLTEQNLQARIRGNLLMALSNKFGNLLLTTGNKSEMAVGYCTLYGDMSGGLAVISDVPKQLVYELAACVNRTREIIPARTIRKAPTAELKPDQKDQDDLPPYEILDRILELHLEQNKGQSEIVELGFAEPMVRDILRRVRINEYKRKQAPMGLKVTTKAFGYGRRYPNVQNYQG